MDDSGDVATGLEDEEDYEDHFKAVLDDTASLTSQDEAGGGGGNTEQSGYHTEEEASEEQDGSDDLSVLEDSAAAQQPQQTNYTQDPPEVFGTVMITRWMDSGDLLVTPRPHFQTGDQTEEFSEENKSIVWFLMKQVRPGMDLSKVVLPTFILEPRSFLDKLSDYYYHADIISRVSQDWFM